MSDPGPAETTVQTPPPALEEGDRLSQEDLEELFDTGFGYQVSGINPRRDENDDRYVLLFASEDGPYGDDVSAGRFEYVGEGLEGDQSKSSPGNATLISAIDEDIPIYLFVGPEEETGWVYQGPVEVLDYEFEERDGRQVLVFTMEHVGAAGDAEALDRDLTWQAATRLELERYLAAHGDRLSLDEFYAFAEDRLSRRFPENDHVRAQMRRQLQNLRDDDDVEFLGDGEYRVTLDEGGADERGGAEGAAFDTVDEDLTWVEATRLELDRYRTRTGDRRVTLEAFYAFAEDRLAERFPENDHVRAKIRQQLQRLRDEGDVAFLGDGEYRIEPAEGDDSGSVAEADATQGADGSETAPTEKDGDGRAAGDEADDRAESGAGADDDGEPPDRPDEPPLEIPSPPALSVAYEDFGDPDDREPVGAGGNADVSRIDVAHDGEHVQLAVKLPRMAGTLHLNDAEQLLAEAETWSKLDDHEHVVDVIDFGAEPLPWIAMEYMDGGHLGEQADGFDTRQALWTALAITRGVWHAHQRGVAHLDLKPENVLFRTVEGAWDVPKVADWGLSKRLLDHSQSVEGLSPGYAAPEQFDEDYGPTDNVTDIYQLGAVFYELFTGEAPFSGPPAKAMHKVLTETPDPPSEHADLPAGLDDVLLRMLAKERADRYDSIVLVRNDLRELYER